MGPENLAFTAIPSSDHLARSVSLNPLHYPDLTSSECELVKSTTSVFYRHRINQCIENSFNFKALESGLTLLYTAYLRHYIL
jgi:hypothetical protein